MRIADRLERNDQVRSLLQALEKSRPGEAARAHRVATYAVATAERLALPEGELDSLAAAATLHNVGWDGVGSTEELAGKSCLVIEGIHILAPAAEILREVAHGGTSIAARVLKTVIEFERTTWPRNGGPGLNARQALAEVNADQQVLEALKQVEPLIQPLDLRPS